MFSLFGGLLCVGGESHNTQKKANYSSARIKWQPLKVLD